MATVGRKKGIAIGVLKTQAPPPGSYLAFFDQGGSVSASLYDGTGAYLSEFGTAQTYSGSALLTTKVLLIRTDANSVVADNSLAWWQGGEITVVQPEVGASSFTALASGWDGDGFAWLDGWFYWMEHEHTPHTGSTTTFRLRKCKADGTGAATVASVDYTPSHDHDGNLFSTFDHWSTADPLSAYGFRVTPTGCHLSAVWDDPDGVDAFMTCQLAFGGGGSTDDFNSDRGGYARPPGGSLATASGTLYPSSTALLGAADTLLAAPASVWPTGGDWTISPANLDLLDADAFLYGASIGIRNSSAGGGSSPRVRLTFADHPSLLTSPSWVFMAS